VYSIGDRVVYPMYGAGVIEAIEDKEIDGELMTYYVLRIPVGNLKIMVSTAKAERNGIRVVRSADEVRSIVKEAGTIEMSDNWNLRYKENMATLKTGDLFKIMEVFKTLTLKERGKSLSSIEKKLMGTAKQIILSEIILSQNVDKPEAENLLMEGIAISL
jgi:CarD family transcriptional regulator